MSVEDNKAKIDQLTQAMQAQELPDAADLEMTVDEIKLLQMVEDALAEIRKQKAISGEN